MRVSVVLKNLALVGLLAFFGLHTACADDPPAGVLANDRLSITSGTLVGARGKEVAYSAAAGFMPLKDEAGKLRARIFYVAYTAGIAKQAESQAAVAQLASETQPATVPGLGSKRPLIFLFNGGPGAASVWLHLGAVGPKRLEVPDDGSAPKPPFRVIDNPYSWLSQADLVFVDPVGTGYSRAAEADKAKEFYGVKEDIEAVGEFVRLYLTKNQRWGSPIYLAGESYGTTRIAGLAPYLQDKVGVSLNGIIFISSVLNFAVLSPREGNDLPYALDLPTYAALAWYHKKAGVQYQSLADCLKDAESFALNDYTVALAKGAALPDGERQETARKLAGFTGLPVPYILESNLRIPPARFQKELLRNSSGSSKIIGRFDGRLTALPTDPANDSVEYDPSLSGFYPAYTSAFNAYIRTTLKYENDLPYEILSGKTHPWNFSGGGTNGYLYVGDDLRNAMAANPHLKVLVCSGHFDLATPYFGVIYSLNHLSLPPELQKNITQTFYPGGHMMYHVKENLEALHKNIAAFIEPAK